MKILYVVHQFFPKYYTGTERFVLNLSKQIQRMGHFVKVLTYDFAEIESFKDEIDDFLIEEYTYQGIPVTSIRHKMIPKDIGFKIFDKKTEKILKKIFNEEFDIIHIAHPMRLGSILKIAKQRNIPTVLTLTDFWLMCPRGIAVTINGELCTSPESGIKCVKECYGEMWKDRIMQRFNEANEFIKSIDVVASPTYFLAGVLKNEFYREISVVRHGIEYSDIKSDKRLKHERDNIVFGYIGTVIPHKGVHIVVEALKSLKNKNIKVRIYGNYFHEKDYFENLKKMSDGDSRIEFLGEYRDEEIPYIMNEADCLLVPSVWWENSPLTILTSLAFKVPVITINIGGAAELVKNGINGFNFEIGNLRSLANVMEKIAKNPEILNKIKDNIIRPPRVEEEAFE
jgi:glycosyltransferase involved in cell wall biosynthesis